MFVYELSGCRFESRYSHYNFGFHRKQCQWRIQGLSDAGMPVWVSKLGAQIKGELMQSNSYLIISSTQVRLHVLKHLSKTLKNGEFDLAHAWVVNSGLCKCVTIYRLYQWIQHFRSTGVPKLGPGYGSECTGDWMISHQPLSFNNMHNNIIYHLLEFGLDYDCRVKPWKRSPRTLPSPLKKSDFSVSLQNIKVFHP